MLSLPTIKPLPKIPQNAEYYDQIHTALLVLDIKSTKSHPHPWFSWQPLVLNKALHSRMIAQYFQASFCREKMQYGEEVARLLVAHGHCENIIKTVKGSKGKIAAKSTMEAGIANAYFDF